MKRTINSTGRQRITRKMVSFDILRTSDGQPESFAANLGGLNELSLPPEASVVVEPYYKTSGLRFYFGTVGSIVSPPSTSLSDIDKGGEILFRVKVIDNTTKVGRLLASGDRLPANTPLDPGDEPGRKPLLPAKLEWLGERLWDISIADTDRPYLLVNCRIPGLAQGIRSDPLLRGAVLVEAFRKVLVQMLDAENSSLEWVASWKTYVNLLGTPVPEHNEEEDVKETFVAAAVDAFANKYQFATQALVVAEPEAHYGD
jgi:hypothetical protein